MRKQNLPPFSMFAVKREPLMITAKVHCEVCGLLVVCLYMQQIDRWLCERCAGTVAKLSELNFD